MDETLKVEFNSWNSTNDEPRNQNNGGNVKGAIVPLNIAGLTWANLDGYYQMNPTNDINGYVLGKANLYKRKVKKYCYSTTWYSPFTLYFKNKWTRLVNWWYLTNYPVWDP
jgi:hypothetical protein